MQIHLDFYPKFIKIKQLSNFLLFEDPPNVTASSSLTRPARVGEDRAVLSCQLEANPPASIIWRKVGSLKVK